MMMVDDDAYYYIGERLRLKGKKENKGVGAKKPTSVKAAVLLATPRSGSDGRRIS